MSLRRSEHDSAVEHLSATRGKHPRALTAALHDMAVTVSQTLGFRVVAVNLPQSDESWKVVASVSDDKALLGSISEAACINAFLCEEYRVHNSYLVPPEHTLRVMRQFPDTYFSIPDLPLSRDPDAWHPLHFFVVPLLNRKGDMIGFFCVDSPLDGRLPSEKRISHIETFAHHAALAVENTQLLEQLSLSAGHLRALLEISLEISSSLDQERTFESIVRTSVDLLHADMGALFLATQEGDSAQLKAQVGGTRSLAVDRVVPRGRGIVGRVLESGQPAVVQDMEGHPQVLKEQARRDGVKSSVHVPIVLDGRTAGVVGILYENENSVPEHALELLGNVAGQAALAIRNSNLYNHARKYAERLRVIQTIAGRLNRLNTPGAVGQAITEELYRLVEYDACRVMLIRERHLVPIALQIGSDVRSPESPDALVVELGQGITGWVAEHGEAVLLDDARADSRSELIPGTTCEDESMIVVPMKYEGEVLGVISIAKLGLRRFTSMDLDVL